MIQIPQGEMALSLQTTILLAPHILDLPPSLPSSPPPHFLMYRARLPIQPMTTTRQGWGLSTTGGTSGYRKGSGSCCDGGGLVGGCDCLRGGWWCKRAAGEVGGSRSGARTHGVIRGQ